VEYRGKTESTIFNQESWGARGAKLGGGGGSLGELVSDDLSQSNNMDQEMGEEKLRRKQRYWQKEENRGKDRVGREGEGRVLKGRQKDDLVGKKEG